MSRRIRVKLTFTMIFGEEVSGISPEMEAVSWFAPIGQTVCKQLGMVSVENVRRELKVVEPRKRASRTEARPRPAFVELWNSSPRARAARCARHRRRLR